MIPVLLLSGILLPMTIGPDWLLAASDWMPFRWVVDAVRTSFAGDFATSPLVWGSLWATALFALAIWWAQRPSAARTPEHPHTYDTGMPGGPATRHTRVGR